MAATAAVANPISPPLCGEVCALSVNVIVPLRFVPLGDKTLVNLTPTVQVAPGAKVVPVHVSAPATALKNQVAGDPPSALDTVTPLTVICAPAAGAALVSVTVPVPVFTPVGSVIVSGLGVIDAVARLATPVPVSTTGVGVTVALV
jgi:hypothetical protein